jgi:hypothetical protein
MQTEQINPQKLNRVLNELNYIYETFRKTTIRFPVRSFEPYFQISFE